MPPAPPVPVTCARSTIGLDGGANPYTYVNANPVNFRDPFGLTPIGAKSSFSNLTTPTGFSAFTPPGSQSRNSFSFPTDPGGGTIRGGLFIQSPSVMLFGHGDGRGFDAGATPDQFRVFFEANFETGQGFVQSSPSCAAFIGCEAPLPFNTAGSPNTFTVSPTDRGFLLNIHAANAQDQGGFLEEIDSTFFIQSNGSRAASGVAILEPFPSAQLFQFQGSRATELLRFNEEPLGPDFLGIPNLRGERTVVPFSPRRP